MSRIFTASFATASRSLGHSTGTLSRTATPFINLATYRNQAIRMASTTSDPKTYCFNHTMFRIKDPKASIKFYTEVLGMELFRESPGPDFTNYFLGYPSGFGDKANASLEEKADSFTMREGVLELCHNHGTESDPDFKGYVSGNEEPNRGFGHICISVDNLEAACKRFDDMGVKFKKRPHEGRMKTIAFVYDPDGYWVEVLEKRGNQAGA